MNANLYDLFQSRFPENRASCCIETGCGRQYSWDDMERAYGVPASDGIETVMRRGYRLTPS